MYLSTINHHYRINTTTMPLLLLLVIPQHTKNELVYKFTSTLVVANDGDGGGAER